MKVIGYMGSPRRGGNTETLLDAILAGARATGAEVEKVPLAAKRFSGCRNCGGCDETGRCIVQDQMQPLYDDLGGQANLVLASPVFFGGLSAQAKAMVDRCQCLWVRRFRLGIKPQTGRHALLAAVCGLARPDMFDAPLAVARIWFTTLGAKPLPPFLVPGVDARGDLAKDGPTLERAFAAGRWLGGGPEPGFRDRAPGFLRGRSVWLRPRRPSDPNVWTQSGQEWAIILPKEGLIGGLDLRRVDDTSGETAVEVHISRDEYRDRGLEADALDTISAYAATLESPAKSSGEKGIEKR